eukprot:gnl/MRDRNA2_/MRDRNA2_68280_c0_seq1.p1 gnl/MRDRNA2_/MRDRNA2_68280_c0~~gnl/MRDRNA2_/MRDRNA2_68280_c0_seq1.p1  ORF type:complete len:222 (-),score=43.99 gnl/MRDRNA2_/MRDRNA2_68280_c0_seq1:6-602(-)
MSNQVNGVDYTTNQNLNGPRIVVQRESLTSPKTEECLGEDGHVPTHVDVPLPDIRSGLGSKPATPAAVDNDWVDAVTKLETIKSNPEVMAIMLPSFRKALNMIDCCATSMRSGNEALTAQLKQERLLAGWDKASEPLLPKNWNSREGTSLADASQLMLPRAWKVKEDKREALAEAVQQQKTALASLRAHISRLRSETL